MGSEPGAATSLLMLYVDYWGTSNSTYTILDRRIELGIVSSGRLPIAINMQTVILKIYNRSWGVEDVRGQSDPIKKIFSLRVLLRPSPLWCSLSLVWFMSFEHIV